MSNPYSYNHHCKCGKKITNKAKKCCSCAQKGELNHQFIDGRKTKKRYCFCGKELGDRRSQKCPSCEAKRKYKEGILQNQGKNHPMFGKHHSKEAKLLISLHHANLSGRNSPMFGKISHGKGSYYKNIWMRSSWEVKFAQWCDKNEIQWSYESKTFDLGNTTYTPDFYLPEFNTYIEVKGWWRVDAKKKFEEFKQRYCGVKIKIVDKLELQKIGII